MAEKKVENLTDLLKIVNEACESGRRRWFRGETRDNGETKLTPGLFRGQGESFMENARIFRCEYPDICGQYSENHFSTTGLVSSLAHMQHYGFLTPLLDWSTCPLIGLYFACSGNTDVDGRLYLLDYESLNESNAPRCPTFLKYHGEIFDNCGLPNSDDPPSQHSEQGPVFRRICVNMGTCLRLLSETDDPLLPIGVHLPHVTFRSRMQMSRFTLHIPDRVKIQDSFVITVAIPAGRKSSILRELDRMGIDAQFVYHDDPNRLKEAMALRRAWA